jgi:membrane-associated protease RseP (regulator of RpoE activity)
VAFFVGIISIFIGFINLVPLPHFDGGQILLLIAQKCAKAPLTRKQRAKIIVTALISIYVAIMVANINKISLYADARIEIAREWVEDL